MSTYWWLVLVGTTAVVAGAFGYIAGRRPHGYRLASGETINFTRSRIGA